ncbi:MAG: hypothetical protein ACOC22_01565 [bacterium]
MVKKKSIKPKPVTTIEMEVAISKMFGIRKHIIVPNLSWGLALHECDLFVMRKSGYAVEVEIKRTFSDFKKDFEKRHRHIDRQNRIVEFYYAFPEELYDRCKDLVPEQAGVILCRSSLDYKKRFKVKSYIKKKAKRSSTARALTEKEQHQVTRLAALRIWSLKERIARNERN